MSLLSLFVAFVSFVSFVYLCRYDSLVKVRQSLDGEIEASYEAEDKLKEAEGGLRSAQTLLEITEAVHATVVEKAE